MLIHLIIIPHPHPLSPPHPPLLSLPVPRSLPGGDGLAHACTSQRRFRQREEGGESFAIDSTVLAKSQPAGGGDELVGGPGRLLNDGIGPHVAPFAPKTCRFFLLCQSTALSFFGGANDDKGWGTDDLEPAALGGVALHDAGQGSRRGLRWRVWASASSMLLVGGRLQIDRCTVQYE